MEYSIACFLIGCFAFLIFVINKKYRKYINRMPNDRFFTQNVRDANSKLLFYRECEIRWRSAGWFWGPIDEVYICGSFATPWKGDNGVILSGKNLASLTYYLNLKGITYEIEEVKAP